MKRTEHTGTPRKVLLVDDNKNGTPARRAALEEQGYEVGSASNGLDALALCEETEYDLVVTDYRMPKMNGVELIAALREKRPGLPIVILSGFAEAGGLTEASTGANIVLQKGSNECQHLVRAVNRLLFHRATRKPVSSAAAAAAAAKKQPPRANAKAAGSK